MSSLHDHDHEHDHEHEHPESSGEHAHASGVRGFLATIFRPHSHDSADSIDTALEGSAEGIKAVKLSLLGLGATAALQVVIVLISGSVALLADTIHNFGDAITAVPLWIAFAFTGRAASRHYTFGYGRAEDLAGIFVVFMIAASAALAGYESIRRLLNPAEVDNLGWVAAAGFLGFVGNEAVAQYRIRVGHRIGSAALVADGYHARTDGFTSIAVLFGAAGVWLGFKQADPLIGIAITVAILFVLKGAVQQMWRRLMDAVEPEILHRAEQAAHSVPGVVDVSLVRPRWIGHTIHAEARVTVDRELSVAEGHRIAEDVEQSMIRAVPKLSTVIVHVDPCAHDGSQSHEVSHHPQHSTAHSH